MNIIPARKLTEQYAVCPECGNDRIGNGEGALVVDEDTFTRSCKCGWKITVDVEEPSEPCKNCFIADWIDMYGTMIYGCNMSSPCLAYEERD